METTLPVINRPSKTFHNQFLICALLFLWPSMASAQYLLQSSAGSFTPIVGGTSIALADPDQGVSDVLQLGFTFTYFGVNYTSLKATAEGFVSFDPLGNNLPFLSNSIQNSNYLRMIAPLWDDLDAEAGSMAYMTTGNAPNRIFTIEWINREWDWEASSGGVSFQLKLFEGTNVIQFIFKPETGALNFPSASAGLVGNSVAQFYSLTNLSASATLSLSGENNINAKPLSGQTFTFTPAPPESTPTLQSTNVAVTNLVQQSLNVNWTNGNGSNRAVFMKQTSANETVSVADLTSYSPSSVFNMPSSLVGAGWYCVYKGTGNSVNVSGLSSGTSYRIQVLEFNGSVGGEKYLTTTSAVNPVNIITTVSAPVGEPSQLSFHWISASQLKLDLDEGTGEKRMIMVRQSDTGAAPAVDNTTYTGNLNFMAGSQIGNSGWYCVYNGATSSQITVTGLMGNKPYRIQVIDYNGPAGSEKYHSTPNDAITVNTFESHPIPNYTFASTVAAFSPLVGGIPVDAIETDDALSSAIPIGFTFRFGAIPFTQLSACSNGYLTFNPFATNNGSMFANSLTAGLNRPIIAPLWDDLGGSGGSASYLTEGNSPNRVFTFEWLNWRWNYNGAAGISFQVKLYELDNKIEFIYRQEQGVPIGANASIGLAFPNTGSTNFISLDNSSAAPTASINSETSTIAVKPASGQIYTFTPQKLNQVITFAAISDKFYGTTPFPVAPTTPSGLPITLQSSNNAVATVLNNQVTVVGVGSVTITASQSGNISYNPAVDVQRTFIVNKGDQVITFPALQPRPFTNQTFVLTGSSTSNLPITFESSNTSVATVTGSTVTYTGVGSTEITAIQNGNSLYNAATSIVRSLVVTKGTQTISFPTIPNKYVDDQQFLLSATATSSLPVAFTSSNPAVATVSGSTITIVSSGFTDITATQSGDAHFDPASGQIQRLTVLKRDQTLAFPVFPFVSGTLGNKVYGDLPFSLVVTATSGLPVTFTSSVPSVATVAGNVITITGAGVTTITAVQAGNNIYNPTSKPQTLVVAKANQLIDITLTDKIIGEAPFQIQTTASSGLPVTLQGDPQSSGLFSLSGNTCTLLKTGKAILLASQAGNSNYYPATKQLSFCINAVKPSIRGENTAEGEMKLTVEGLQPHEFIDWYVDDQPPVGLIEYIVYQAAKVKASIVVGEGCFSELSDPFSVIVTGVPTRELEGGLVSIFPNPFEQNITITLPGEAPTLIQIFDALGRKIKEVEAVGNANVNMDNYPHGVYWVKIKVGVSTHSKRVVKL